MDDERFDALVRGLGRGASRRGVLAGLAGLALGEAAAKGRGRPGKKDKVTLCHHDQDKDTWHPITVSKKAADKHKTNHGDFAFGDGESSECCATMDCGKNGKCEITVDAKGTVSGTCEHRFATCTAQTQICGFFDAPCGAEPEPGCACFFTYEDGDPQGARLCINFFTNVCADHYGPCQDHADCYEGDIFASTCCNDVTFGPGGICVPACGNEPSSAARRRSRTENGPTLIVPWPGRAPRRGGGVQPGRHPPWADPSCRGWDVVGVARTEGDPRTAITDLATVQWYGNLGGRRCTEANRCSRAARTFRSPDRWVGMPNGAQRSCG